jgi:hypothetical protein
MRQQTPTRGREPLSFPQELRPPCAAFSFFWPAAALWGDFGPSYVRFGSKADILAIGHQSALHPKADIAERDWDVRFVPIGDIIE